MSNEENASFFLSLRIKNPKVLILKLIIIFVPTFLIAFLIDKMVYVLPTLALGLLLGTGLDETAKQEESDPDESESGDGD